MARGVQTPMRVTGRGGVALTPADDGGRRSLLQVIAASLYPGQSAHPWAVAAGRRGPGGLYDSTGGRVAGDVQAIVRRRFGEMESQGRARLVAIIPQPNRRTNEGRRQITIEWQNLEQGGPAGLTPSLTSTLET